MSFLPTNPGTAKHEMALFLQKNPHTDNQELIDRYKHFRSVELSGSPCKRGARTMFFTLILSIDAGFPEGVFQTLVIGVEPVKGLLADPRIHGVTFTGSVRAGRDVHLDQRPQVSGRVRLQEPGRFERPHRVDHVDFER